jgi:hypothetical protein
MGKGSTSSITKVLPSQFRHNLVTIIFGAKVFSKLPLFSYRFLTVIVDVRDCVGLKT